MNINIRAEVEHVLGRKMTTDEAAIYLICRNNGYANPIDIARKVREG